MGTCRFFGGIRIATPACAPVRNDIFLRVRRVSSGGTHGCRPTRGNRGAQQIGRGSTPPLRRARGSMRSRRRGEGTPPYGERGGRCRRVVGEIGEAPPVAGEASRFRGSAPIGGHDSGRESAGTTAGNRRPLRMHGKEMRCGGVRIATPACGLVRNDIF